jgi:hypothetical protein
LGRLGKTLPTERLATATTDRDGSFSLRIHLSDGPPQGTAEFDSYWRTATALYPGSKSEWSTTAFESLDVGA